jgi:hypothetical protein
MVNLDVTAQNWDDYLTNVHPEVQKSLESCPERINIFLPLDAINESKEEKIREKIELDSKTIKEKLSKRGKLDIYRQSFKIGLGGLRSVAYCLGLPLSLSLAMINPLLILTVAYIPCVEYLAYRTSKKENYSSIRNLENIPNNVFTHYTKKL